MPQMQMSDWLKIAANFPNNEEAERFRNENGIVIADTNSAELPALPGQSPVYDQPTGGLNMASAQEAPAAQQQSAGPLSEEDTLRQELLGYPAKQAASRAKQLALAQQNIAQMYAAPSQSQQLFALSRALLSPAPYRGFAGVVSNLSNAFSDIEKAKQQAMQKRANAEFELRSAYDKLGEDDTLNSLKLRYQLVKEANDAKREAAKAGQPKYQWDAASGRWVIQPGTGGLPPMNGRGQYIVSSPEQAASVPTGQPFVYTGDTTGKVYYGR